MISGQHPLHCWKGSQPWLQVPLCWVLHWSQALPGSQVLDSMLSSSHHAQFPPVSRGTGEGQTHTPRAKGQENGDPLSSATQSHSKLLS